MYMCINYVVSPHCLYREFKLVDTTDEYESSLPIKQFQYTDWPEDSVPESGSGLIDLIGQVQKWQISCGGDQPIIIHCRLEIIISNFPPSEFGWLVWPHVLYILYQPFDEPFKYALVL